ncbi:MAG: SpoIID/LytB domain-containing protein [bacterium]
MKQKFLIILVLVIFVLVGFKKSFAQQTEPCLSPQSGDLIRVGISTNNFSSLEYKEISITTDAGFIATDKSSDTEVIKAAPKDILKFQINKDSFIIYQNDKKIAENIAGPLEIIAENDYPLQVVGLKRNGKQAAYRGIIEITKTPGKTDKLSVINMLPLEEYLKGVVPNELPVSFGLEALKAQAIAARNYALRPRDKANKLFDVCDSVQSQVYFGANTENPISNEAIKETSGLLALYDGDIILALYSSTAGGYTENYENAFSEPGSEKFPAKPLPYLKGKPDTEGTLPLNDETAARNFYTSSPPAFDINSGYYRWTRTWTEEELRKELNNNFNKFSKSSLLTPAFEKDTDIGKIKKVEVLSRGVSGKIIALYITTEKDSWTIKKELLIRRILTTQGKALPSANVIFNNINDENGDLVRLEAFGGGLGHGVGMSQYGAGFMSKSGCTFDMILQHYYDGISIGTRPVIINCQQRQEKGIRPFRTSFPENNKSKESQSSPIIQEFFAPDAKADLMIENQQMVENFDFMINSNKISLNKNYLPEGTIRMPLDKFIIKGLNEIVFYPCEAGAKGQKKNFASLEDLNAFSLEKNVNKNVKVWVEVVKSKK